MRFIRKLWGWLKRGVQTILKLCEKKNPVELAEDATKAIIGVASTGAVVFAAVNGIRVALMKGKSLVKKDDRGSGDELISQRTAGTLDEKLAALYKQNRDLNKNRMTITQEDLDILTEVSKDRNAAFRSLKPEDQLNLLKTEGFDFEAKRNQYRRAHRHGFRRSVRRVGQPTVGQPFREPVDYGWLNFIMRPLDDFLCWLRNDPVPKKVPQIRLIQEDDLRDLTCESGEAAIQQLQVLNPYFDGLNENQLMTVFDDAQERIICAEEIFRHNQLKKYRKAVNARMAESERGLSSTQLFELLAQEERKSKKKKHKKNGKSKSKDGLVSYYPMGKESKKKKDRDNEETEADREAQKMYRHFLKDAAAGRISYSGYHLDRIF